MENKVSMEIFNPINENIKKLESLFPGVVKDGQVDFEALKQELGQFEEVGKEKYELTWPGKTQAKQLANTDIVGKTLKYVPEDSKNPETTENLYIEGDNLEVLKLLRNSYYGKIKMIYIDPPYNTGNDFVYRDDYSVSAMENDKNEGNIDEEGNRLIKNQAGSGRFHSNWLNMMYPRLKIAKDLLTDDGVIFISIDDNEQANIKKVCDEVFGEENFVAQLNIITGANQSGEGVKIQKNVEYCLAYAKEQDKLLIRKVDRTQETLRNLNDAPTPLETRPDMGYTIYYNEKTNDILPIKDYDKNKIYLNNEDEVYTTDNNLISQGYIPIRPGIRNKKLHRWRWGIDTFVERKDEITILNKNGKYGVYFKQEGFNAPKNYHNFSAGTIELKGLFNGIKVFDYPKNSEFIKYLINIGSDDNSIILDFFSGVATTAHATMKLNAEDGGSRKFIMVQLPELCDEKSEAFKAGFTNICEIGKERIRRAGEKIKEEFKDKEGIEKLDVGFKVFRVADTNIRWNSEALKEGQITMDEASIKNKDLIDFNPGFTDIDVVYEIMLRHRDFPLTSKIERLSNIGERTYIFADAIVVCLEEKVTDKIVDGIAAIEPKPIKVIFRDSAFDDDISLKLNTMNRLDAQLKKHNQGKEQSYRVEFI